MIEPPPPELEPQPPDPKLIVAVWTAIIVLVLPRLMTGLVAVLQKDFSPDYLSYIQYFFMGVGDIALVAALAWLVKLTKADLGFAQITLGDVLFAMCLGVMWSVIDVNASFESESETSYRRMDFPPAGGMGVVVVVLSFLATGFGEELFFRGFLIPQLRKILGGWLSAVVVSSVLFAISHLYQGHSAVAFHFACSMVIGSFYVLFPRVIPFGVGHALCNVLMDYQIVK